MKLRFVTMILLILNFSNLSFADEIFIDDDLQKLDLKPHLVKYQPIGPTPFDRSERSKDENIDIEFGQLTLLQFNGLMTYYRGQSHVKYNSERIYFLTDFLTPQMQALYGLDFNSKLTKKTINGYKFYQYYHVFGDGDGDERAQELKDLVQEVQTTAQCWGTACNNLRTIQKNGKQPIPFEISMIEPGLMQEFLLSNNYSVKVRKNQKYKYGDLLAMLTMREDGYRTPVHFPIYIGFGLVFEKEDAHFGNPYRIVSFKDSLRGLTETVNQSVHEGEKIIIEPRRFLDIRKPDLPKISKMASFLSALSYGFFGRIAARMMPFYSYSLGGAEQPEVDIITKVDFDIDTSSERGVLRRDKIKALFSPAYEMRLNRCSEFITLGF